ncbi:MAG: hypothetical protein AB1477_08605 [Acidobacteriota bacterium]
MFALIGLTTFALVMLGVFWLLMFPKSVVWSFRESGGVSPVPGIVIFNPFRDKKPEAEAEKFLSLLKNDDCEKTVTNLPSQRENADICESVALYKLEDWKLIYRKDSEKTVELYYRVKNSSNPDYVWERRIDLEKTGNEWKVTDIGSIY